MDCEVAQDTTAVRVAVRVRPLITREVLQGSLPCVSTEAACVTIGRDRRFTFDHAFGPNSRQDQIYEEVVSPLVESCFDGFNVTVLAYGQTGSGKTFTMGTGECKDEEQLGIAPRVIRHVFQGIEARKHQATFYVRAQFLEIYNEDVKDLLLPPAEQAVKWVSREQGSQGSSSGGGAITLRDAGDGTIMVIGASEESADCAEALAALLERGMALRATSSTCANEQSSRSHAILTIIIEQHLMGGSGRPDAGSSGGGGGLGAWTDDQTSGGGATAGEVRAAKLHLVDLAGSERTKQLLRTSMQGPRFRETVNINQGLLALGNVISALGDERRRGAHVPYRESKLTRLLQDSLGGNSRTAMIACVSPADEVLEETLNTLKYANRAKNIRNKPVVNRALPASALSPLCGVVLELQLQVLQQLAAQLLDSPFTRELPLAELLALDTADPTSCLEVMLRMKSALATTISRSCSLDGGAEDGRQGRLQLSLAAPRDPSVETLLAGCSRTIAGVLQGLAEMEAQGQVGQEARDHILRALDTSTLRLLPAIRKGGAGAGGTAAAGLDVARASRQEAAEGEGTTKDRDHAKKLEDRIRALEVETATCRAELQDARDDLERDEIIFADKMKELEDTQTENSQLKQQLAEAEKKHAEEVEELRKQLAALQAAQEGGQPASRAAAAGGGVYRAGSRTRLRRHSSSGVGSAAMRRGVSCERVGPTRPSRATGDAQPAAGEGSGSDPDGERAGEEDEVLYDEELLSYISETDYTEQHSREMLESDVALREQLAEVLREKAAAEAERAALERAALTQRSSFDAARAALEQQLSQLSGSISKQQEQLQAAQAAEKEARELAAKWQDRARELESAIEVREEALAKLRAELAAVEDSVARTEDERASLRQQYEQRIATVVAQVNVLQRQLQQHSSSGGSERRERQQSAERMAATEAEIARLRAKQADLRRQLCERVARYERESAARVKELAALRKAAAAARTRMQTLEQENRAQRVLLREKQEEVAAAKQRLRDQQRSTAGGSRLRSNSPGSHSYGRGRGPMVGLASPSSGHLSSGEAGCLVAATARGRVTHLGDAGRAVPPGSGSRGGPGGGGRQQASPGRLLGTPSRTATHRASTARSSLPQLEDAALSSGQLLAAGSKGGSGAASLSAQPWKAEPADPQTLDPEQQHELGEWAEQLLAVVADAADVEARVEVLASRHRGLQGRREQLVREKAQFGLRTQRRVEQLVKAVAACDAELADLVGRIPSPRYETPPSSNHCTPRDDAAAAALVASGAPGGVKGGGTGFGGSGVLMTDDWVALQQRIADVSHLKATLEEKLRTGRTLDEREQQVIDSLDDQMDDLDTQLAFVTGELADRRAALAQLQRRCNKLQQRTSVLGTAGLRVVLTAATDAVRSRAVQVRQLEAALAATEAGAARREAQLQVRLRESLVSLSAHLASLEANSPAASGCMNSSDLRDLLGIYLDLNASTASFNHSQGEGQPHPHPAQGEPQSGPVPRAAADCPAPTTSSLASLHPAFCPGVSTAEHGGAASASVHRLAPTFPAGDIGRPAAHPSPAATAAAQRHEPPASPAAAARHVSAPPQPEAERPGVGPAGRDPEPWLEAVDSFADSLAGWGTSQRGDGGSTREPAAGSARARDLVDLSLRSLPHGSPRKSSADLLNAYLRPGGGRGAGAESEAMGADESSPPAPASGAAHGLSWSGPGARGAGGRRSFDVTGTHASDDIDIPSFHPSICAPAPGQVQSSSNMTPPSPFALRLPAAAGQPQPQPGGHRRTDSGGTGTGTGGTGSFGSGGGILRRAGSMESVGSSVATSSGGAPAKRVTWSAHVTAGPGAEGAAAGAPGGPGPGAGSAPGGFGAMRNRERSILDRAVAGGVTASGAANSGLVRLLAGSQSGGTSSEAHYGEYGFADRDDGPGVGRSALQDGHSWTVLQIEREDQHGRQDGGAGGRSQVSCTARASASSSDSRRSGDGGGGRGVGPEDLPHEQFSRSLLLVSVDSGGLDDTARAVDARTRSSDGGGGGGGGEPYDPNMAVGSLGGVSKPGPRSFNPWRASGSGKQQHQSRRSGMEQPSSAAEDLGLSRRNADGGGDDLLPQDSDSLLRLEGEDSATSFRDNEPPSHSSSGRGLWLEPRLEGTVAGAQLPRTGVDAPQEAVDTLRLESSGSGRYAHIGSDGNGFGGGVVDLDEADDELEEHVRLLAQAAAVAKHQQHQEAPTQPTVATGAAPTVTQGLTEDTGHVDGSGRPGLRDVPDRVRSTSDFLPLTAAASALMERRKPLAARNARGSYAPANTPRSPHVWDHPPPPPPGRSASPVQHYGRVERQHKGPFTTPPPAILATPLAEALLPYKAHLKRSAGAAALASPPEDARGPQSSVKAGRGTGQRQQLSAYPELNAPSWTAPDAAGDRPLPTAQPQQPQLQQPWRSGPTDVSGKGAIPGGRSAKEERRYPTVPAAARQRSFVP